MAQDGAISSVQVVPPTERSGSLGPSSQQGHPSLPVPGRADMEGKGSLASLGAARAGKGEQRSINIRSPLHRTLALRPGQGEPVLGVPSHRVRITCASCTIFHHMFLNI